LDELKAKSVRIIIADFYASAARAVICGAYQKKMTASDGYIWFLPMWYPADWYDTDVHNFNASAEDFIPCTTAEMAQVLAGSIFVVEYNKPYVHNIHNISYHNHTMVEGVRRSDTVLLICWLIPAQKDPRGSIYREGMSIGLNTIVN
jgi:hypothetical protein